MTNTLKHKRLVHLLELSKQGNAHARNELVMSCENLIFTIAAKYASKHITADDLKNEALLHCLKKVNMWNPDKGALTTFITVMVRRFLCNFAPEQTLIRIPHTTGKQIRILSKLIIENRSYEYLATELKTDVRNINRLHLAKKCINLGSVYGKLSNTNEWSVNYED